LSAISITNRFTVPLHQKIIISQSGRDETDLTTRIWSRRRSGIRRVIFQKFVIGLHYCSGTMNELSSGQSMQIDGWANDTLATPAFRKEIRVGMNLIADSAVRSWTTCVETEILS